MKGRDRFVEYLVEASTYVRSVDGFLVKLGSVIVEIEEYCKLSNCSPHVLLGEILSDDRLNKLLDRLSCYKDNVVRLITTDPRHRRLRDYLNVVTQSLEKHRCIEEESLSPQTPPPTWFKETVEAGREIITPYARKAASKGSVKEIFIEKIQIAGVILALTILILSLIKLLFLR